MQKVSRSPLTPNGHTPKEVGGQASSNSEREGMAGVCQLLRWCTWLAGSKQGARVRFASFLRFLRATGPIWGLVRGANRRARKHFFEGLPHHSVAAFLGGEIDAGGANFFGNLSVHASLEVGVDRGLMATRHRTPCWP